jgi:hypothetical protein
MLKEFPNGQPDITRDSPQEGGGDVPTRMEGNGSRSSVGVAVLTMRTPLPSFHETESFEDCYDLSRLQDGAISHATPRS